MVFTLSYYAVRVLSIFALLKMDIMETATILLAIAVVLTIIDCFIPDKNR